MASRSRGPANIIALLMLAITASACASTPTVTSVPAPALPAATIPASSVPPSTTVPTTAPLPTAVREFALTSSAFNEGANIPPKFTCTGDNVSPQLKWSGAPGNTKSFVLIMDDPDAPGGTFTHWVVFDMAPKQNEIAEGASRAGKSGQNSARRTGYMGPCPPSGTHRYFFTLYAIDLETLGLNDGASRVDVEKAMSGHIIAKTQFMGRYSK